MKALTCTAMTGATFVLAVAAAWYVVAVGAVLG